jgi:hypothetical protein
MKPATYVPRPGEGRIACVPSPSAPDVPIEPWLEELTPVAGTTSSGAGAVVVGILVAAGLAGGLLMEAPAVPGSDRAPQRGIAAQRLAEPATREPAASTAPADDASAPTLSVGGGAGVASGGVASVEVTTPHPLGRVRVDLVVAGRDVATAEADVPDRGTFPVPLTVPAVPFRLDALVRLTWLAGMDRPQVLAEAPVTVLPASGVELLGIASHDGTLEVEGIAPPRVERVRVALMDDDGRELAAADTTVESRSTWGGTFPALGRFAASLEPRQAPEGTLRLIVAWTDPWTNADSSRTTILVAEEG